MRLTLVLLLATASACSQTPTEADRFAAAADSLIAAALDGNDAHAGITGIPGLAMAVIRGDEVVYLGGHGDADREANIEATADTPFYIASSTKSFTALLAVLLDAEGTIDLDVSLAAAFPETDFTPGIRPEEATLRDLLSHTHGVVNNAIVWRTAFTGEHTPEMLRALVSASTPNAEAPLGTFDYTNVGYNIFSIYLDRATGKKWQDLLDERIFTPARMDHTTAYASEPDRGGWDKAAAYTAFGANVATSASAPERLYLEKHDNTMQAAGGMYASARDLARWVTLQLNDGKLNGRQVFPSATIQRVHTPVADVDANYGPFIRTGYGLGWYTGSYDGEAFVHHFGGFGGAHAHVSFMPERDLGVVVLVNEDMVGGLLANLLSTFAYEWWLGRPDVRARFNAQLDQLVAMYGQQVERVRQGLADRAKREWTLTRPADAYIGSYRNAEYGTFEVVAADPRLAVRFGNLHAVATPFTAPETMRVELVPGQGQVIGFRLADGRADAVQFDGDVYVRVEG